MYNFFTHKKESRLRSRLHHLKDAYRGESENRKELNNQLSESYRRRIEGFAMSMIDKPVSVQEFRQQKYEPRSHDNTKSIGGTTLYFKGFRREGDRIESEIERNKILDEVPFTNCSGHRFRGQSSKPSLPMHYKPQSTLERLELHLKQSRHNELENVPTEERLHTRSKQPSPENIQPLLKKVTSRSLLPTLHQKTHFKSLVTIYNGYPQGILNGTGKRMERGTQDAESAEQQLQDTMEGSVPAHRRNPLKTNPPENFNPRETSKQALARCNLLPKCPPQSNRLKKGGGLTVNSDSQTYKKLYCTLYQGKVKLDLMR